jgi:hypothetical protein
MEENKKIDGAVESQLTLDSNGAEDNSNPVHVVENFGPNFPEEEGVINTEVTSVMKKSYLDYAMSVIVSRAIPSIEDGMEILLFMKQWYVWHRIFL